jgi:hypothetical protein
MRLANKKFVCILILAFVVADIFMYEAMVEDLELSVGISLKQNKIPSQADWPETHPVGTDVSASDSVAATNATTLALDQRSTSPLKGTSETRTGGAGERK